MNWSDISEKYKHFTLILEDTVCQQYHKFILLSIIRIVSFPVRIFVFEIKSQNRKFYILFHKVYLRLKFLQPGTLLSVDTFL